MKMIILRFLHQSTNLRGPFNYPKRLFVTLDIRFTFVKIISKHGLILKLINVIHEKKNIFKINGFIAISSNSNEID
jgi:hypothetical protein